MTVICKLLIVYILLSRADESFAKKNRMVNGLDAEPGEFPYQVSLQYKLISDHFCGGAILNERFVITAAHCFSNLILSDIQAVVGTTNLKHPKSAHDVISIYRHENYTIPRHLVNDIALVKIYPPFKFDGTISPVILPRRNYVIPKNAKVIATGWGTTGDPNGDAISALKKVILSVTEQEKCAKLYERNIRPIFPTQLCTFEIEPERRGVCTGDSGGPLTIKNVLVGIVSWSTKDPDCASSLYPDVHTRVSEYIDWIKQYSH